MGEDPSRSAQLAVLERCSLFSSLTEPERATLLGRMELCAFAGGQCVFEEDSTGDDLFVVVTGEARLSRRDRTLRVVGPGEHFGALGHVTGRPRMATVRAIDPLCVLRLQRDAWRGLAATQPSVLTGLLQGLLTHLRGELIDMTDDLHQLLRGRTVPRVREVTVQVSGERRTIPTGTLVRELVPPARLGGPIVVAGLLDQKPVSLDTPLFADGSIGFLTSDDWQGRQIFVRSAGLLLLEAAHRVAPGLLVRLGPSRGTHQLVELHGAPEVSRAELAERITDEMCRLSRMRVPFRREAWTVEEATAYFVQHGWHDAAALVRTRREATVSLVSCGSVYAPGQGPILPDAGPIEGFSLRAFDGSLVLEFGPLDPRQRWNGKSPMPADALGSMARAHRAWLEAMGVSSVGAFNDLCISGRVSQLVRVAEGFHEKRLGQIADDIAGRRGSLRIICIAGPSSSGKTTFIKRLRVQLQVSGLSTVALSLDDYYVDREKTIKDARGEYDFEALEALDLPLLRSQLRRLLAGEAVAVARYDFKEGKSHPEGGATHQLGADHLLLVEGIHGLNPRLFDGSVAKDEAYRIFIHPATTLPFDRLTRVSATDMRLLRRIVRDRRDRGNTAAGNIKRWPSVQAGEQRHIFPFQGEADAVFDSSLVYEPAVLKVYAERYLLEVSTSDPAYGTAHHLRHLLDPFVAIYPDHVPPTSLLREFIGGSGFEF